jgi:hypothetical protein
MRKEICECFMIRTLENDHDLYDLLLKQKRENTTFENEVE